ncbi:hypothetical protein PYJP_04060 [Pyrofollis japonicus]|uniref:hypothetical protein n=1 Tax=Pyrofollis japonicus TaxID=3060460 RepID=UPI00295B5824|nr:hypothetical protein [Pyrofollis japonicus]BEP17054.1 hypothetical protein PYJP_04060 [Pyrofollis japonicus]
MEQTHLVNEYTCIIYDEAGNYYLIAKVGGLLSGARLELIKRGNSEYYVTLYISLTRKHRKLGADITERRDIEYTWSGEEAEKRYHILVEQIRKLVRNGAGTR